MDTCPNCQQPIPDDAPFGLCVCEALVDALEDKPALGGRQQVGAYRILRKLGEGGFGEVFLATQKEHVHWRVALKILKRGVDSAAVIRRFAAEQKALALMDHPNVAAILDGGVTDDGLPFFVLEYVEGEDIKSFCRQHQLGIEDRLRLFMQVCRGVHHAHQKGIIHRDLKPSNVMVSAEDGEYYPKVIDFGIAKAAAAEFDVKSLVTRPNQLVGTLGYMSPEQARAASDIDVTSDIYSLGCLLYELLTGVVPIGRSQVKALPPEQVIRFICEVEPPIPSARLARIEKRKPTFLTKLTKGGKRLRGDIDWIVMKALAKDRSRRYESTDDFARDIDHFLNHLPVTAQPESRWYVMRKFAKRHRAVVIAGAAIATTLVAGSVVSTQLFLRAEAKRRSLAETQDERRSEERRIREAQADADRFIALSLECLYPKFKETQEVDRLASIAADAQTLYSAADHPNASLFYRIGEILRADGNPKQASAAYENAAAIAEEEFATDVQVRALLAMAAVHDDPDESLSILHKTEESLRDEASVSVRVACFQALSEAFEGRGQLELAISYALKAESALKARATDDEWLVAWASSLRRLGALHLKGTHLGDAEAALEAALRGLSELESEAAMLESVRVQMLWSDLAERRNQLAEAIEHLAGAVELLWRVGKLPENWRMRQGLMERKLARLCAGLDDPAYWRQSKAYRASAIDRWEALLVDLPKDATIRRHLAREHFEMAQLLKRQGRYYEPYKRQGIAALSIPQPLADEESVFLRSLLNDI